MRPHFPTPWKDLCLQILTTYKEEKRLALGYKRLGWERIRDIIMSDFDVFSDGQLTERDSRLKRQDLEAWERGTVPSDQKFIFIDRFIRQLELNDELRSVYDEIKRHKDKYAMDVLADLYQSHRYNEGSMATFRDIAGFDQAFSDLTGRYMYSEEVVGSWFKGIVIRVEFHHKSVWKIAVAYCPSAPLSLDEEDYPNTVFYEGFLIPYALERKGAQSEWEKENPKIPRTEMKGFEFRGLAKLIRPEFKGNYIRGYAEGEMHMNLYSPNNITESSIRLDHPVPIMLPANESAFGYEKDDDPYRTSHNGIDPRWLGEKILRENEILDPEERTPLNKLADWSIKMKSIQNPQSKNKQIVLKFDNLFNSTYKGYIF